MFKAIDLIVGEIIESDNLYNLLEVLEDRWEDYQSQGLKLAYQFINGVRYLISK